MTDNCVFCNAVKTEKELCECYKRKNYTEVFKAALIIENYHKEKLTGSYKSHSFDLNFCPVCGRKFEEDELCINNSDKEVEVSG